MKRLDYIYDIFDIESQNWKYREEEYEPINYTTVPFGVDNDNVWDQHWDQHFAQDSSAEEYIDLTGEPEFHQLIDDMEEPTIGDMHLCTRAMLTHASTIYGSRFCKNCGMIWPNDQIPLW